jgi:tetratricopeptide (TPR) repeat protein
MPVDLQQHSNRKHQLALIAMIVAGLALVVVLSKSIDARRPPVDLAVEEERLYVNGNTAKRLSLSFNGLIADWYWMRSLQYVGRKVLSLPEDAMLDRLGSANLKLLPALLDTATSLDPEFIEPYEYGAIVLPVADVDAAIRLTKKGIAANPSSWRLYHHLGYIYWQRGDLATAAETYGAGGQIPGAPEWMTAMKAKMLADGGGRATAREIYSRMYEGSTDEKVKEMAQLRLLQLDAFDQIDILKKLLETFKARTGRCPASWKELEPIFRARRVPVDGSGAPLDPSGTPYEFKAENCDVAVSYDSKIPVK